MLPRQKTNQGDTATGDTLEACCTTLLRSTLLDARSMVQFMYGFIPVNSFGGKLFVDGSLMCKHGARRTELRTLSASSTNDETPSFALACLWPDSRVRASQHGAPDMIETAAKRSKVFDITIKRNGSRRSRCCREKYPHLHWDYARRASNNF